MSEGRGGGTLVAPFPCRVGAVSPRAKAAVLISGVQSVFGDPFPDPASVPAGLLLHTPGTVMSRQPGVPKGGGQSGLMPFLLRGKSRAARQWAELPSGWEPGPDSK